MGFVLNLKKLLKDLISVGDALRSNATESIVSLDLARNNLYVRRFNEGAVFGLLKVMSMTDDLLYNYLLETKNYIIEHPASKRTTFLSHQFWERILVIYKELIIETIKNEIQRNGGKFGVLTDTTRDVSKKEQISVIFKYTNVIQDRFVINECTVAFKHIKITTGSEIFNLVKNCVTDLGLDLKDITGKKTILCY